MKINRDGITRIVLLTKKYAIKIPRMNYGWQKFIQGMYCNMSEAECWKVTESIHLCPVLFSFGGFILVMPRVQICTIPEQLRNIPHDPGQDLKPDNYGYYQDRIVCVDYAFHKIKPYLR